MYAIALHDTETEDVIGYVHPIEKMDMKKFDDELRISWTAFQPYLRDELESDYSIEDFVEWHNENYQMKIDYAIIDFIQL